MPDFKPQGIGSSSSRALSTKPKPEADEDKPKRRKEEEPDGTISTAVQYLKMGFLPIEERLKAEKAYESSQAKKRKQSQD